MDEDIDFTPRNESGNYPVAPKVKMATVGATAGVIISNFLVYLIDLWFYIGPEEVPEPVSAMVMLVVTAGLTFIGGWYARHQYRLPPRTVQTDPLVKPTD